MSASQTVAAEMINAPEPSDTSPDAGGGATGVPGSASGVRASATISALPGPAQLRAAVQSTAQAISLLMVPSLVVFEEAILITEGRDDTRDGAGMTDGGRSPV